MSMNDLGVTLISLAQYAEAETLLLQAHEIQSRVLASPLTRINPPVLA